MLPEATEEREKKGRKSAKRQRLYKRSCKSNSSNEDLRRQWLQSKNPRNWLTWWTQKLTTVVKRLLNKKKQAVIYKMETPVNNVRQWLYWKTLKWLEILF